MSRSHIILPLVTILVIVSIARSEAMSGAAWYDACRTFVYASKDEVKALPIEKRLRIRDCRVEALRTFCDQGWFGDETHVKEKLMAQGWSKEKFSDFFYKEYLPYCPDWFFNMPIKGPAVIVVDELEKTGGPGFFGSFMPALPMLVRTFNSRYPHCTAKRKKIGLVNNNQSCFDSAIGTLGSVDE